MLKKTISYEDFFGNKQTEEIYFNLSADEIADLELSHSGEGGLSDHLKRILDEQQGAEIMSFMRRLISGSYGVRSEDGKHFLKTPEQSALFMQSAAYQALFLELVMDPDKALEFMNGIMPANLTAEVEKRQALNKQATAAVNQPQVVMTNAVSAYPSTESLIAELQRRQANGPTPA